MTCQPHHSARFRGSFSRHPDRSVDPDTINGPRSTVYEAPFSARRSLRLWRLASFIGRKRRCERRRKPRRCRREQFQRHTHLRLGRGVAGELRWYASARGHLRRGRL